MRGLLLSTGGQASVEDDFVVFHAGCDAGSRHKTAREDQLRQRVFDPALDRTFQRSCAIHRVVTYRDQLVLRFAAQFQRQLAFGQTTTQAAQLDLGDAGDLIPRQWLEDHHFIDPVDKFRAEV